MSCETCLQRVPADQIGDRILKTIDYGDGVDYCAARGIPLGRPDMDSTQLTEVKVKFAESCSFKDDPTPPYKLKASGGKVGRAVGVEIANRSDPKLAPRDCRQCVYLMQPTEVRRRYGWGLNLCMAKGELLPTNKLKGEATRCNIGIDASSVEPEMGVPVMTHENVRLLGVYGTATEVTPVDAARSRLSALPDPRLHVSDKPVDAEDQEQGIRAWRGLKHPDFPELFETVWLPVYDPEWSGFSDKERRKIPVSGDDTHPELYADYQNLLYYIGADLTSGLSPVLVGPAGTGKTEFYRFLAWTCQLPFDRISVTNSTELADIIGKHLVTVDAVSGEAVTEWVNGRIPEAIQTPGVLCIDEPNLGPKDVMEAIRPIIDSNKQLVLDQDRGQIIMRHWHRFLGFAMNPSWDYRYQGTSDMNEADLNRMTSFAVDFPQSEVERDIIINFCNAQGYAISNERVDAIIKLTEDLRPATDPTNGTLSFSWGMRSMLKTALSTRYKTLEESVRSALADNLDPTERSQIMGYVKTIL